METFPHGWKHSHLDENIPTWMETLSPGLKYSHLNVHIPTWMQTFSSGWKYSHMGGNILTWVEIFSPGWSVWRDISCVYIPGYMHSLMICVRFVIVLCCIGTKLWPLELPVPTRSSNLPARPSKPTGAALETYRRGHRNLLAWPSYPLGAGIVTYRRGHRSLPARAS